MRELAQAQAFSQEEAAVSSAEDEAGVEVDEQVADHAGPYPAAEADDNCMEEAGASDSEEDMPDTDGRRWEGRSGPSGVAQAPSGRAVLHWGP